MAYMNNAPTLRALRTILCVTAIATRTSIATATDDTPLPKLNATYSQAQAFTQDDRLVISTGLIERTWQWTGKGLVTLACKNLQTGKTWTQDQSSLPCCDWSYPGLIGPETEARLVQLTAQQNNDEGFTSDHLQVVAEVVYPSTHTLAKYVVWAYPNAAGLRTQLWLKRTDESSETAAHEATGPMLRQIKGSQYTAKAALAVADPWYCSVALDGQSVEFRASGLKASSKYMLGLSWWDWGGGGRKQSVRVTSIDSEADLTVIPPTDLPKYKDLHQMAAALTVEIPGAVRMDDTCRIYVDRHVGPNANVSELWLYEQTERSTVLPAGPERRVTELSQDAPEGYRLVAYLDAGAGQQRTTVKKVASGRVDYLPVVGNDLRCRYVGYYNDTQHRNTAETPILREEVASDSEPVNWASILSVEDGQEGLLLVKESHKCANQSGVDTGEFILDDQGLHNTGTSLKLEEITSDRYRWCWASWCIVYHGGKDERELAFKQFDRRRYPIDLDRDMWSVVCTWGHSKNPRDGRNYATEKEVLREMDVCADIGVDMLLIDDGWQVSLQANGAQPDGEIGWKPHPQNYPDGWANVIRKKDELGLRLGLWGVAQSMPLKDMQWNWDQLGMGQVKLDFANLRDHDALEAMMQKARQYMLYTGLNSIMSWDTTENAARYGYFWAREYGNVHFMNRKPFMPVNVLYVPWLALRDYWQLSHYQNLNKWQLTIQNPEATNRDHSDAYKHSVSYCAATALMGTPEFMAVPRFYSDQAKAEIRDLLATYKKHRQEIFTSYVFPLGDEPDNASWTGFQACKPGDTSGYLLVFRELENGEVEKDIPLRFVDPGTEMILTDLQNGRQRKVTTDARGEITFTIEQPADFRLLKYQMQE